VKNAITRIADTSLSPQQGFDTSILAGRKSPATIGQYRLLWQAYTNFAGSWSMATQPTTLALWRQHLYQTGYTRKDGTNRAYTVSAINVRLAAVRSVMAEAAQQGFISEDVANAFKAVKGLTVKANKERRKEHSRTAISVEDMNRLCDAPDVAAGAGLMHRALLMSMRYTGARISDIVGMRRGDIELHTNKDGQIGWVVWFMGKNEAEPVMVELGAKAKQSIDKWLSWRDARGITSDYIFTSFAGHHDRKPASVPISRVSAWAMVKRYADRLKLEHIKPHDFRRYVGTQLAKKDIRLAQKQLRHKRLETTLQHYVLDDVALGHMDSL
jgi:integrase/recombinase XerD